MYATLSCPNCGSTLAVDRREVDREARCDRCGTVIHPLATAWNPYAPPSSSPGDPVEGAAGVTDVPSSVLGKFGLAFRLLGGNLVLFSLVILTVWVPINIVIESVEANAAPGQEGFASFRLNSLAQGLFGPIAIGGLIFAVSGRIRGERVTYPQALLAGLSNWGRLVVANLVAGLLILAGYVCLIIPGIILQIRFALVDPVVVMEPNSPPRQRSRELTRGKGWQILSASLLFFALYLPLAFASGFVFELLELPDAFWFNVVADCILDVFSSIFYIVLFLFYWEGRHQLATEAKAPDPDIDLGGWKVSPVGGQYS